MRPLALAALAAAVAVGLGTASPASAETAGEAVRAALLGHGFGAIADRVVPATRISVRIGRRSIPRAPRTRGTSRIGGPPDLPVGMAWPRCHRHPQSFLMQLRLHDLPAQGTHALRRLGGRLLLFTDVEFEPGEHRFGLWAGRCTRVVHVPAGTPLRRVSAPRATMRLHPARVAMWLRADLPEASDEGRLAAPLRDLSIGKARVGDWWAVRDELWGTGDLEHQLLGYPHQPNGWGRCYERTLRAHGAWRHLVTFGVDEVAGFEVADAGRLQVMISPRDLRRGRFNRVCTEFDSG